ncbi:cytochrome P450 72A11-like [Olea europaea subsp. europaea]|uniref:Cytochrome P450 72A11-like n=1 Tax=Olea europaea subsp. europaea TaxID=158383 RepID=A0A8S0R8W4_OLEEU|nr:cytochrome P450 72A11-like [Olea europaea subsp. europaea]
MKRIEEKAEAMKAGKTTGESFFDLLLESELVEVHGIKNTGDIIGQLRLFYFVGYDTASMMLVWTMVLLSIHQNWQQRAREEVFQVYGGGNVRVKSRFVIQVGDTNQTTPYNLLHRLMKMTEKPKVDSGSDSLSSNCEFEGKGNQNVLLCDRVNGLQQQGIESDSFVVDMDRFEEEIYKKSRIKLQRNLSRKGSLSRGSEKKINQSTSNNIRDTSLVANSPRGYPFHRSSMLEIPVLETLGAVDHAINFPVHNQITVMNGTVDNMAVESKYFGKRFSFRRSSSSSWIIDPRRILIFFATMSSLGTVLLIYLTLSMSKLNAE